MLPISINQDAEGVTFQVRVSPRAKKSCVLGVHDGALKLSLLAPPVDGAANEALIAFLAKALSVARGAVHIQSGEHARLKRIRIAGVTAEHIVGLLP